MPEFLKKLVEDTKSWAAAKVVRLAAAAAAGAVATWLAHLLSSYGLPVDGHIGDLIKEVSGGVFSIVAGGGALAYSIWDGKNVGAKMAVASSAAFDAGVAQAQAQQQLGADAQVANDNAKVAAVASAMKAADLATKQDKASIVAALKTGTF